MDPDLLLLEGLCERRASALEEVFRRHGERVHRLCLSILGSAPDAEDATQEIFLTLFERAASFSGRARFTTWLHRVTVNHCLNAIERERTRATEPLGDGDAVRAPEAIDSPIDALLRDEARVDLERMLARLSVEHRVVVVLREIEELTYQEIADALEIPVGTVMSRLSRAREQLVRLARPRAPERVGPAPREP